MTAQVLRDFYVTQTLIGGDVDCNRRRIYRGADDSVVWERRAGPNGWDAEDQAACDEALRGFREAAGSNRT